jgi:hypothetical protein
MKKDGNFPKIYTCLQAVRCFAIIVSELYGNVAIETVSPEYLSLLTSIKS